MSTLDAIDVDLESDAEDAYSQDFVVPEPAVSPTAVVASTPPTEEPASAPTCTPPTAGHAVQASPEGGHVPVRAKSESLRAQTALHFEAAEQHNNVNHIMSQAATGTALQLWLRLAQDAGLIRDRKLRALFTDLHSKLATRLLPGAAVARIRKVLTATHVGVTLLTSPFDDATARPVCEMLFSAQTAAVKRITAADKARGECVSQLETFKQAKHVVRLEFEDAKRGSSAYITANAQLHGLQEQEAAVIRSQSELDVEFEALRVVTAIADDCIREVGASLVGHMNPMSGLAVRAIMPGPSGMATLSKQRAAALDKQMPRATKRRRWGATHGGNGDGEPARKTVAIAVPAEADPVDGVPVEGEAAVAVPAEEGVSGLAEEAPSAVMVEATAEEDPAAVLVDAAAEEDPAAVLVGPENPTAEDPVAPAAAPTGEMVEAPNAAALVTPPPVKSPSTLPADADASSEGASSGDEDASLWGRAPAKKAQPAGLDEDVPASPSGSEWGGAPAKTEPAPPPRRLFSCAIQ